MAISISRVWKGTYRALAPVVLCGFMHAQTAATPPAAAAASAPSSLAALHIAKLPDATTALASSTVSASQSLHVLVGQSIFITHGEPAEAGVCQRSAGGRFLHLESQADRGHGENARA